MRIEDDVKLDFDDVLIRPKRSTLRSRKDVVLDREYIFKHSGLTWVGVPIMAANMDTTGTMEMSRALAKYDMLTCLHKFYTLDDWKNARQNGQVFYNGSIPSIGAGDNDLEWYRSFYNTNLFSGESFNFVCIDVANGYGEYFVDFVSRFRDEFPDKTIIAGNVVTGEMTEQLILSGADIVKVGLGSGASCKTRLVAGVGSPQFSAVIECADAAHGLGGHIISDGGCRTPGDVSKSFGAGCFIGKTPIILTNGMKKEIKNIEVGDEVYTHTFQKKKVKHKFEYDYDGELIKINGITSTPNHKYYVLNKKYKDVVTKEDLNKYAEWVKAKDLDKEKHFLLKLIQN